MNSNQKIIWEPFLNKGFYYYTAGSSNVVLQDLYPVGVQLHYKLEALFLTVLLNL
jgi:hypothetical protein